MSNAETDCVLLAGPHHGLSDGIRLLLSTVFKTVVMVGDEASLFETADRLRSDLAVVDLALATGNVLDFVRRLRDHLPDMKVIAVSVHDGASVSRSVLDAGAHGFVIKAAIANDLLAAIDAVVSGKRYVSPPIRSGSTRI
jgi:DNA-binding NarL/FixJ family response regulator